MPGNGGIALSQEKVQTLLKKYFSIPKEHLHYYPSLTELDGFVPSNDEGQVDITTLESRPEQRGSQSSSQLGASSKNKKVVPTKISVGARKPGRPKKVAPPLANTKFIMSFFNGKEKTRW